MKNLLTLLFLFIVSNSLIAQSNCGLGTSQMSLDINNTVPTLGHSGLLWSNGYIFPNSSGEDASVIPIGGLWIGGNRADGSAVVAVRADVSPSYSYHPGPISLQTNSTSAQACIDWDKHFSILRTDVDSHLADFADDGQISEPNAAVFSWPGRENPHSSDYNGFDILETQNLAPFVDVDNDNIYDPMNGDYPDVKGDQAIWWVFNDVGNSNTTNDGQVIGMEIQAMAYAYQSSNEAINNTVFYDFKLLYRGEETLTNFQTTLWTKLRLGCWDDDRFGIDSLNNMAFYYNEDFVDGILFDECGNTLTYGMEVPMLGIKLLCDSENLGVTSLTYSTQNDLGSPFPGMSRPMNPTEHLNYMSGLWQDGEPYLYGRFTPLEDGTTTKYPFSGNPANEEEWSMCSYGGGNNFGDIIDGIMMSSGGTDLNPGDIRELTYAMIVVPNVPHPCPDLNILKEAADIVSDCNAILSGVANPRIENEVELLIEPNPTNSDFNISTQNMNIENVEVFSISGERVHYQETLPQRDISITLNETAKGLYIVKVQTVDGKYGISKLVIQ